MCLAFVSGPQFLHVHCFTDPVTSLVLHFYKKRLQLYGFAHDEQTHEKHHNEKSPHEESV